MPCFREVWRVCFRSSRYLGGKCSIQLSYENIDMFILYHFWLFNFKNRKIYGRKLFAIKSKWMLTFLVKSGSIFLYLGGLFNAKNILNA